ncbi:MAG: GNAT family N-acetyltransferase [Anaerolineae bacterium]|jgi:mycothiol synthase|nr:GNAT family N-acetyltransferase [Anaerolineae bacterium]MBT7192306.1 GNAT family N-acetyltransferase [Anaerolineae bacterium]MBT7783315.1 GNAT family N-acetyltransferase [Anaerolineae bacterium]
MKNLNLETGLTLRPATMHDLEAVVKLVYDVCVDGGDTSIAYSIEELKEIWEDPNLILETDTWIVTTKEGRVVGYEEFYNADAHAYMVGDGYVHPDFMGKGIGTAMLQALNKRGKVEMERASPELRVYIRNGMGIGDSVAREMHEAEGYTPVRFSWQMAIELNEAPPKFTLPKGIELRPFNEEAHAQLIYEAHEEAFSINWGHAFIPFEEWKRRHIETSEYKPELWSVLWDGDEVAGYAVNHYKADAGYVSILGVRPAWRKGGLGLVLLNNSFSAFYNRGTKKITLAVDASSPTGATRLYKRAGMSIASEYVSYEKELRAGKEL